MTDGPGQTLQPLLHPHLPQPPPFFLLFPSFRCPFSCPPQKATRPKTPQLFFVQNNFASSARPAQNAREAASTTSTTLAAEPTRARPVHSRCTRRAQSSTLAAAGRHTLIRSPEPSGGTRIAPWACCGPRSCAPTAAGIWDMSSKGKGLVTQRMKGIASTALA